MGKTMQTNRPSPSNQPSFEWFHLVSFSHIFSSVLTSAFFLVFSSTYCFSSSLSSLTINRLLSIVLIVVFVNQFNLVHCQLNESAPTISSLTLIDPSEVTTSFTFSNLFSSTPSPTTLPPNGQFNSTSASSTIILDLATNATSNATIDASLVLDENSEKSEVASTTKQPNIPDRVTAFLDESDEVNTQSSTMTIDVNPIIRNDIINQTDLSNSNNTIKDNSSLVDSSTSTPAIQIFKSPSLPSIVEPTNSTNQSLIDSPTTTELTSTIDLVNGTIRDGDSNYNYSMIISNGTSSQIRTANEQLCDSSKVEIDHYQAKKFFLLTMILLGFCCLLIIIVLVLVVYIYRKLSKERTVKIPNNVGSVEFDTIKDGRFHQWQGNINSAFDAADLTDATARTGYRFMDGSVVPYSERYHTDIKSSSTETFGHHHLNPHHGNHHSAQSSFNNNSLPKTIDTRL